MRRHINQFARRRPRISIDIMTKHGCSCPYCGISMRVRQITKDVPHPQNEPNFPSRDHVIPKSWMPGQGFVIVCRKCNMDKADRPIDIWHEHLVETRDQRARHVSRFMAEHVNHKLDQRPTRPIRTYQSEKSNDIHVFDVRRRIRNGEIGSAGDDGGGLHLGNP